MNASDRAAAYYLAHPNVTLRAAGARFGITGERVRQKLGALGHVTRTTAGRTDATLAAVPDLDQQTPGQIAAATGLHANTVAAGLRRRGIAYPTLLEAQIGRAAQMIQEARKGQKSITELAVEFDMAYVTVRRALASVGIRPPYKPTRNGTGERGSALVDAEGLTIYAAAKRVGCAPDTIRNYRMRRGLPVGPPATRRARGGSR